MKEAAEQATLKLKEEAEKKQKKRNYKQKILKIKFKKRKMMRKNWRMIWLKLLKKDKKIGKKDKELNKKKGNKNWIDQNKILEMDNLEYNQFIRIILKERRKEIQRMINIDQNMKLWKCTLLVDAMCFKIIIKVKKLNLVILFDLLFDINFIQKLFRNNKFLFYHIIFI